MKTLKTLIFITLFLSLLSCIKISDKRNENDNNEIVEISKPDSVEYYKVLIAKTIEENSGSSFENGNTYYLLAFNDGYTESTSFGYYSCLNIGDTIRFAKQKGDDDYWIKMFPNCK